MVRILSQLNVVHTHVYDAFKVRFDIIFISFTRRFPKVSFLDVFRQKFVIHFSSIPFIIHAPSICPP
jgi:hypothetical protein